MEEIHFAFSKGLRKQVHFIEYQYPSAGNTKRSEFLGYVVNKFLPILYRSNGIVIHSSKDENSFFCGERVPKNQTQQEK